MKFHYLCLDRKKLGFDDLTAFPATLMRNAAFLHSEVSRRSLRRHSKVPGLSWSILSDIWEDHESVGFQTSSFPESPESEQMSVGCIS